MKLAGLILCLLLAGAALTHWRAARAEAAAEAASPPSGRIVEVDGHKVHAWVQGSGPDLVLIHGSSGHLGDFTHAFARHLAKSYRVIAFDRPGLGYTPALSTQGDSLKGQADLLQKAARDLGAERPIVLGQSLGGAVALAWAVHHPDAIAALVTVSGVANPWSTGLGRYYTVLSSWPGRHIVIPLMTAFLPQRTVDSALEQVFAPNPVPDGFARHFNPRLTLRRTALRQNALQRRALLGWVQAQAPAYGQITAPTEILHGTDDKTVSLDIHARPLARTIPGAHLTEIAGAGHMPHHTHPGPIYAAIDRAAERAGLR